MTTSHPSQAALAAIREAAHVLQSDTDIDAALKEIGDAEIVLLGEATHGTREFYRFRTALTARLILEKGFDAVAVEADWPDALEVNRHIQAASPRTRTDADALAGFERFPQWMWRNTETVQLVNWLRRHNEQRNAAAGKVGFYGLDLYSLRRSMESVIRYLSRVDPAAAQQARASYGCFDSLADDPQRYGYAANHGMRKDCEDEVVRQLMALAGEEPAEGDEAEDELFHARQNARVAANAEAYYRGMFQGRTTSWNLRDTHMDQTLAALQQHISARRQRHARIVAWAHNSHIGDARATEMGERGQLNLGQLVRQRMGPDRSFLLGFSTHGGTVTAADAWDGPAEVKTIQPSDQQSYERLFHDALPGNFFLPLRRPSVREALKERRLERAIGVIYLPKSERISHYFEASLRDQFDALVHFGESQALQSLDRPVPCHDHQPPDTWPSGL